MSFTIKLESKLIAIILALHIFPQFSWTSPQKPPLENQNFMPSDHYEKHSTNGYIKGHLRRTQLLDLSYEDRVTLLVNIEMHLEWQHHDASSCANNKNNYIRCWSKSSNNYHTVIWRYYAMRSMVNEPSNSYRRMAKWEKKSYQTSNCKYRQW